MAHKYDDFDSAFYEFNSRFGTVKQYLDWAYDNAAAAYSGASDPVDKLHFGFATYAIQCIVIALRNMGDYTKTASDQSWFYESIYWANKDVPDPPAYELTMGDILSTMLAADEEEVMYFIGLVDAYRTSLWNKPFNAEYYAALARGFME